MKIYRAIFYYNNADTCEWENWYYKASVWYNTRELAEAHLDELNKFKDFLINEYFKEYKDIFRYKEPYIQEEEIHESFVDLNIDYNDPYKNN